MNGEVVLRKMELSDIDQIYEVELASFTIPWTKEAFFYELLHNEHAYYLVAEIDGQIVGYCGMWLVTDEAHVTNIAVLPEERGKRLGERLMNASIEAAKEHGARLMTLEVRISNRIAQNLYRKFGFQNGGIRRNYYTDTGEDALVMWVNFND